MTALEDFLQHPTVSVLGWTLVHFLWQGAVIATLLGGAFRLLRRSAAANARYGLACGALLLMAVSPAVTFVVLTPLGAGSSVPPWTLVKSSAGAFLPPSPPIWLPLLVAAWGAGVLFLSLRLLGGWVQVERLKRRATRPINGPLQDMTREMARRLRITRPVVLLESAVVQVPTVLGGFRSVILVPASALSGLPAPQLEALLAHELAHIRRWDYLVNLLQTAIETLLFYHPAVWWISRQIRVERENCCDDMAVSLLGDRHTYVRALASLEELRAVSTPLALAGNGGDLLARIRRLLGRPSAHPGVGLVSLSGMVCVTLFSALAVLHLHASIAGEGAEGSKQRRRTLAQTEQQSSAASSVAAGRQARLPTVKAAAARRQRARNSRTPRVIAAQQQQSAPLPLVAAPAEPRRRAALPAIPPPLVTPAAVPLPVASVAAPAKITLARHTVEPFAVRLITPPTVPTEVSPAPSTPLPPRGFHRAFARNLVDPQEQADLAVDGETPEPATPRQAITPAQTVKTAFGNAGADDNTEDGVTDSADPVVMVDATDSSDSTADEPTEDVEITQAKGRGTATTPPVQVAEQQSAPAYKTVKDVIEELCRELARLDLDVTITQVRDGVNISSLSRAVRHSVRLIKKRLDHCPEERIMVWIILPPEAGPAIEGPAKPEFLKPDTSPLQAD